GLQDVGARYYTFQWTLALAMRACARAGVEVVVLDRPNPLGGAVVEGNVPDPAFASFVGLYPLPARPGLTLGELARWLALEHGLGGRLSVVEMRGWRRAMLWEDTGVPWVAPSPNVPTPGPARVYPGRRACPPGGARPGAAPRWSAPAPSEAPSEVGRPPARAGGGDGNGWRPPGAGGAPGPRGEPRRGGGLGGPSRAPPFPSSRRAA